jgi:hypothetical protein
VAAVVHVTVWGIWLTAPQGIFLIPIWKGAFFSW